MSPGRTSLRLTSWALCSVAISTVEPATLVGSITPNGVTRPVRPVLTSIARSLALTSSGGYLNAIAHRGAAAGRAEPALQRDLVDLDHDAVDLVLTTSWRCSPYVLDVLLDACRGRAAPAPGRRSAAPRPPARRRPADCAFGSNPSRAPMPWQTMPRARVAVTRGSFCRSEPAAALRGLANGRLAGVEHRRVEPLERLDRQEHLAAHLDQRRAPGTRRCRSAGAGWRRWSGRWG